MHCACTARTPTKGRGSLMKGRFERLIQQLLGAVTGRSVLAYIDFENISNAAFEKVCVVDFRALHDLLLQFGPIAFAYVCTPEFLFRDARNAIPDDLNDLGFEILVCQKDISDSTKIEDTVDQRIIQHGMRSLELMPYVTDVVVIGNDKHMKHLLREVSNHGLRFAILGTDRVSGAIKRLVGIENVHPVPLRGKSEGRL